jgi:hypothetical protein
MAHRPTHSEQRVHRFRVGGQTIASRDTPLAPPPLRGANLRHRSTDTRQEKIMNNAAHRWPMRLAAVCALALLLSGCGGGESSGGSAAPGPGAATVANAGALSTTLGPIGVLGDETTTNPSAVEIAGSALGQAESLTCTLVSWGASDVKGLADRVALGQGIDVIYPGALLQGASYQNAAFTPITIARAGGTITLSGVTLPPGSLYSATVSTVSVASIQQAIQDLLAQGPIGTVANFSFDVEQVYDSSSLAFSLGVDGKFGNSSVTASLNIDSSSNSNYVLAKFTQVFYSVSIAFPTNSTDVFRDGANFSDPAGQIGAGNPPLYVSKVSFGKQVFFLMKSEYSAHEIKAAIQGAYDGGLASASVDSNVDYQTVMSKTHVTYVVNGGSAEIALAPIDSSTPEAMYDAVKTSLAGRGGAVASAANPGTPIAYTLTYLKNNAVAEMAYSAVFDKKDCVPNFVTPVAHTFSMVTQTGNGGHFQLQWEDMAGGLTTYRDNLDDDDFSITAEIESHIVEGETFARLHVNVWPDCPYGSHVDVTHYMYADGVLKAGARVIQGYGNCGTETSWYIYDIDPTAGTITLHGSG